MGLFKFRRVYDHSVYPTRRVHGLEYVFARFWMWIMGK